MTDEQINQRIAKYYEYTHYPDIKRIPNFCNDLNAMHDAEKVLTDDQRSIFYPRWLGGFMSRIGPIYATAYQRAEAFLRTLGKWEEKEMTDNEIDQAIAEACGWTDFVAHPEFGLMGVEPSTHKLRTAVPCYVSDLNAMHEVEMRLTKEQVREYQTYMYDMACEIDNTCGRWMPYSATARYRAEAFLKTLGKWEESK